MSNLYHRYVRARVRHLVGGIVGIVGLSRLGVLSVGPDTSLPGHVYGGLLLACTLALALTAGRWRSHLLGRSVAGLTACVLVGLAFDFLFTIRGITTALILLWLALWLLWEAVAEHEC